MVGLTHAMWIAIGIDLHVGQVEANGAGDSPAAINLSRVEAQHLDGASDPRGHFAEEADFQGVISVGIGLVVADEEAIQQRLETGCRAFGATGPAC